MQHDSFSAGKKARVISNIFCARTEANLSARKDLTRRINLKSYAPHTVLYLALYSIRTTSAGQSVRYCISNRKSTSANLLSWRSFRRLHASSRTRSFTRKFITTCNSPFSPDVGAPKAALGLKFSRLCPCLLRAVAKMYLCDCCPDPFVSRVASRT